MPGMVAGHWQLPSHIWHPSSQLCPATRSSQCSLSPPIWLLHNTLKLASLSIRRDHSHSIIAFFFFVPSFKVPLKNYCCNDKGNVSCCSSTLCSTFPELPHFSSFRNYQFQTTRVYVCAFVIIYVNAHVNIYIISVKAMFVCLFLPCSIIMFIK